MEVVDFIKKIPTRIMIIWISCFDNARTIEEIAKIWGYSSGKVLQLGSVPSKMIKYKLLRVEKIEKRQMYFRSSFEVYPEILKELEKEIFIFEKNTNYEMLFGDSNVWLKILDKEEYKKTFLEVYQIRNFFKGDRNIAGDYRVALYIPILGLGILTNMKVVLDKIASPEDFSKVKNIICFIHKIVGVATFPWDIEKYIESINKKLNYDTFLKITEGIEKTGMYKIKLDFVNEYKNIYEFFFKFIYEL
ncbi:MAG: hypothetical protein QXS37_04180 [Candidatus Aenigmatarchaeota archaeon]